MVAQAGFGPRVAMAFLAVSRSAVYAGLYFLTMHAIAIRAKQAAVSPSEMQL
jgi:hypothetical protein